MAEDEAPHGGLGGGSVRETSTGGAVQAPAVQDPDPDGENEDLNDDLEPRQTAAGRSASVAIVLLTIVLAALVILRTTQFPRTDAAEVFANYIGMAPIVNGPIVALHVRDNQQVRAGEELFRIDPRPYQYTLTRAVSEQAQLEGQIIDEGRRIRAQQSAAIAAGAARNAALANVQSASSGVDEAAANLRDAAAALATAKAEYVYSLSNLHRIEPLLARQFVTADQVEQLRTGTAARRLAVEQAEAQQRLAEARLQSSRASLNASEADVSRAGAQQQQQQRAVTTLEPLTAQRGARASAIEDARYNLENCVVAAPFDARVTNLTLSNGAYARAGQQVFTLIDTRTWWVIANFRETQLRHILPGMHVAVYLLSNPERMYRGVVESASFGVTPDASTIGTLTQGLPDVQRTLSWVRLASRYPVRIRILDPEPNAFRIAESAVVEVRGWRAW